MIDIGFGLELPITHEIKNLYTKDFPLTKNKIFEFNLYKDVVLVKANFDYFHAYDHAGATLWLGLLGYNLEIKIFDKRHWNYDANRWYLPGEEDMDFIESISEFDNEDK